ncbi:MAG TPA: hypothetical protein PKM78_09905 [Anaerolineae bacterium]|nr:hypothetical protein [Anaerolineae bacterium]HNU04232.1 hypothetical protein [Anaerolineae bacterium]
MEHLFLVFIALPLVVGGAVLVGAWLLTKIMPGDAAAAKAAAAAQAAAIPAHGPDYARLTPRRKAALRTGIVVLLGLALLTIVEFFLAALGSTALMFVIIILKAALIMYFFMHIAAVWRTEEAH